MFLRHVRVIIEYVTFLFIRNLSVLCKL